MNGDEIKAIYEQLDERGKRIVEVIAHSQLKYAREGLQKARGGFVATSAHNLPLRHENDEITGRDDKIEREENAVG